MKRAPLFCTTALIFVVAGDSVHAQPGQHYQLEIAIISSVSFVTESHEYDYRYDYDGGSFETDTYVLIPANAPGLRFTFWTKSPVLVDAGLMLSAKGNDGFSAEIDKFMIELGLGVDLGKGEGRIRPFLGALGGGIMYSTSDFRNYVGGQAGVRFFVKDYAAVRVQIAHRSTMGNDLPRYKVTEIAGGIGFLL
jgi:hypothetical protein